MATKEYSPDLPGFQQCGKVLKIWTHIRSWILGHGNVEVSIWVTEDICTKYMSSRIKKWETDGNHTLKEKWENDCSVMRVKDGVSIALGCFLKEQNEFWCNSCSLAWVEGWMSCCLHVCVFWLSSLIAVGFWCSFCMLHQLNLDWLSGIHLPWLPSFGCRSM